MTWASGRLEVRDNETGMRIAQFKPTSGPVFEADYNDATKQLLVTGQHGLIRLVDSHSGNSCERFTPKSGGSNMTCRR